MVPVEANRRRRHRQAQANPRTFATLLAIAGIHGMSMRGQLAGDFAAQPRLPPEFSS